MSRFRCAFSVFVVLLICLVSGCNVPYTPRVVDVNRVDGADVLLCIPALSQYPDYPTGCESVTAVMALNYAGVSVGVNDYIDNHLPCDNRFYERDGLLYGPDPYAVFVGDPRSAQSYGCMAPVIENALLSVGGEVAVCNTTGQTLASLCARYIDNGVPVILWATMEMRPVGSGRMWFLPDGRQFTWPSGEHCLLLVGYNESEYLFNDPRHGAVVAYDQKSVEVAYASLGKQSLVVESKTACGDKPQAVCY